MRTMLRIVTASLVPMALSACLSGCLSASGHRRKADERARHAIEAAQKRGLGRKEAVDVESPADTLRRRLLIDRKLPHRGAASLGVRDLPDSEYWKAGKHLDPSTASADLPALEEIGLLDALQISARNSREYREAKEKLFAAALDLDLEGKEFQTTFSAMLEAEYKQDNSQSDSEDSAAEAGETTSEDGSVNTTLQTGEIGITRRFLNGIELSGKIVVDLVRLLTQDTASALGLSADASISIPLLRGASRKVAAEPLKQAEQNLLYQVYAFERFRREFAVRVAEEYPGVLREGQQVRNVEENYKRLVAAARRARRLADAGRLPEFQFDQAVQDELRARTRWVDARQNYASRLDGFKLVLGLPPDAGMGLDPAEVDRLRSLGDRLVGEGEDRGRKGTVPPADAEVELKPPGRTGAGPLEIDADRAVRLALDNRLDLRAAEERVGDAQRKVMVAADALRAELTLLGKAEIGERRNSASSASKDDSALDVGKGVFSSILTVDLPLERTAERVAYRRSLLALEKAVRDFQEFEDEIKLDVRGALRDLMQAREGVLVQLQAVALAEKRVRSTDMFLQAGRAQVRDVLDSQEALLNAQNALTAALVSYRAAELRLQRDIGLLEVSRDGLWKEYNPEEGSE